MERTEADLLADVGAARPDEEMNMDIVIINYKARPSGMLMGFGDLCLWGLTIRNVKLFHKPSTNQAWISPPAEKSEGRDGQPIYTDLVEMTPALRKHISHAVADQILGFAGLPPRTVGESVQAKVAAAREKIESQQQLPVEPAALTPRKEWKHPNDGRPSERASRGAYEESRAAAADPAGADIPY